MRQLELSIGEESERPMSAYMFIDGGFLRETLLQAKEVFDCDVPSLFDYGAFTRDYARTFYYDALPDKKPNQTDIQYEEECSERESLFKRVGLTNNVHVKTGITRFRKKRGNEQKAVDILLALDVYRHAISGNIDTAVIATSDLDFCPVLDVLRDTKVRSVLRCNPKRTSPFLIDAADMIDFCNEGTVMQYLARATLPKFQVHESRSEGNPYGEGGGDLEQVSMASGDGWTLKLYRIIGKSYIGVFDGRANPGWASKDQGCVRTILSPDFRCVRLLCEGRYGINLEEMKPPQPVNLTD